MSDIKAARVEYVLSLEQSEFNLLFRAVGKACGAKASFKVPEMEALRKLNAKLAATRLAAAKQAFDVAVSAHERAEALLTAELPEDTE